MGKFTKTLVAGAIAGLVAGPAQADGVYVSTSAVIQISAVGCITERISPLEMDLQLWGGEGGGSNVGWWESDIFRFGDEILGGGPFIAAKPVTNLTMGLGGEGYDAMEEFIEEYLFGYNLDKDTENCKVRRTDGFGLDFSFGSTDITEFQTKVSKNEERAKVTLRATGSYLDIGADKDREVKLIMKSRTMLNVLDGPV